jgi:type IV secretory pathway VirJ component
MASAGFAPKEARLMRRFAESLVLVLGVAHLLTVPAAPATPPAPYVEETVRIPLLGQVAAVHPRDIKQSRGLVLFISGDGGWKLGVVGMARRLGENALVVGLPMPAWQKLVEKKTDACWYPAGELESIAQAVEKTYKFPRYLPPILVGYSSGATVVYGVLAQSPAGSFAGGVSLGFCPDLEVRRPFCSRGDWKPTFDPKKGVSLLPVRSDLSPRSDQAPSWIALQGQVDKVCDAKEVGDFVSKIPSAQVVPLPKVGHGFGVTRNWGEAFDRSVATYLEKGSVWEIPREPEMPSAPNLAPDEVRDRLNSLDLPLVVSWPKRAESILIFLSGDGGWMELDREVSSLLHRSNVAVVGWNTLHYFWEARTPDEVDRDLTRIIQALSDSLPIFAGGYSFGAEVVPVSLARLQEGSSPAKGLSGLVLLAPGPYAAFEVSPLDWIFEDTSPTRYPVAAALARERHLRILCIDPASSDKSGCPLEPQPNLTHIRLPGSHHFGGDYDVVAEKILQFLQETGRPNASAALTE